MELIKISQWKPSMQAWVWSQMEYRLCLVDKVNPWLLYGEVIAGNLFCYGDTRLYLFDSIIEKDLFELELNRLLVNKGKFEKEKMESGVPLY